MKERDALYYPYIHVRDINWLKGTLLCFPHVFRMVPSGFSVNDTKEARPFSRTKGRQKRPLLDEARLESGAVWQAQDKFRKRLEIDYENAGTQLHEKFSLVRARREYADGENAFQIHRGKFSSDLLDFLKFSSLAWEPSIPNRKYHWVAVHPILGEAFMSTMAAAVAKNDGLDIVTSSGPVHAALALKNEDAIYDRLVRGRQLFAKPKESEVSNHLLELVIQTRFDASQLTAKDIASMSKDREGLFTLKEEIGNMAAKIPAMENRARRDKYLSEAADEVIERWQESKRGMSKFARRFFGNGLGANAGDFLKTLAKSVAGGSVTGAVAGPAASATASTAFVGGLTLPVFLGAGAGLAVGVLIHGVSTAAKLYEEEAKSSYRYLSRIEKGGATLVVSAPKGKKNKGTL